MADSARGRERSHSPWPDSGQGRCDSASEWTEVLTSPRGVRATPWAAPADPPSAERRSCSQRGRRAGGHSLAACAAEPGALGWGVAVLLAAPAGTGGTSIRWCSVPGRGPSMRWVLLGDPEEHGANTCRVGRAPNGPPRARSRARGPTGPTRAQRLAGTGACRTGLRVDGRVSSLGRGRGRAAVRSAPKPVTLAPCCPRFGRAVQKAHGGSARCRFGERAAIGVVGSCLSA